MAGISPLNINVNQSMVNEANTNAPQATGIDKSTRVAGQSQDNLVNIATSSTQNASENQQYSHQRHIALQGYLSLGQEQEQEQGAEKSQAQGQSQVQGQETQTKGQESKPSSSQTPKGIDGQELTEEEQQKVKEMKERHEEVRVHENAHKSAGGQYAAAPTYTYETGPDGKRYITDGEVSIDIGEEKDPQATIEKMQIVKRAAMAPAEPSGQDRKVYQDANQKEAAARQELAEDKKEEAKEKQEKAKEALNGQSDKSADTKNKSQGTKSNEQIIENSDEIKVPKSASGPKTLDTGSF